MHPVEARFIEIVQRFDLLAHQMAAAFQVEQVRSGLDQVLDPGRLQSSEGTLLSLLMLDRLRAQTQTHSEAFHKFMLAFSGQLGAVLGELPAAVQDECRARWRAAVDGNLEAQTRLYENRRHWIDAAAQLCELIESRRDSVAFTAQGITFSSDAEAQHVARLLAQLRDIRELEAQQMEQRAARLGQPPQAGAPSPA